MSTPIDNRLELLKTWLSQFISLYHIDLNSLRPASADASFRRYFRVNTADGTLIIMDAPPSHEDCAPFIDIAQRLRSAGINAPQILQQNLADGFLLLNDLGDQTYYQRLLQPITESELDQIYRDAIAALVRMQSVTANDLPIYDKSRLRTELALFPQWYISQYKQAELSTQEAQHLENIFTILIEHNDQQAKVFVHRDFHSPNLMLCQTPAHGVNPGVIDFQDALLGPISYDLVSLVMDARTTIEEAQQLDWAIRYWEAARAAALPVADNFADFHKDYEFMGLQRNLRIMGVFARLALRDNKTHYLDHMPRVQTYVKQVANRYQAFKPLMHILNRLDGISTQAGYTF